MAAQQSLRMVRHTAGLLPLLLVASLVAVRAQMGDPFGDWTPEGVGTVKSDIPYIKCEVCKKVSQQLISRLSHKKRMALKSKPVGELQIMELTEKICDRKAADGGWILRHDMEEDGDRIKLVEYDFDGECANECRTIQRACEEVLGDRDTELAELLHTKEMDQDQLETKLCLEMTDSCTHPPPPVPEDRKPGEKFEKPKPKDYGRMAEDMGIKQSVMHNTGDYEIPEGMPRMPPPKHLQEKNKKAEKKKNKKKKKKGGSSRSSSWESMSEL